MGKPLKLKRNDLQPYLYFVAEDQNKTGVDLTGATFATSLKNVNTSAIKINRRTTGIFFNDASQGDDILLGKGHFEWAVGETDTSGTYDAEIEVTPGAGGKFTLGPFRVIISDDIDNA